MNMQPALLLDLDGTVRHNPTGKFINQLGQQALLPDVEARIWEYKERGYLVIGVSNQGGVAFGIMTPELEQALVAETRTLFDRDPFDAMFVCYAMPNGKLPQFSYRSLCRKPEYGMLVQAELHFYAQGIIIDWENSLMVGDREEDRAAAQTAGVYYKHAADFFGWS